MTNLTNSDWLLVQEKIIFFQRCLCSNQSQTFSVTTHFLIGFYFVLNSPYWVSKMVSEPGYYEVYFSFIYFFIVMCFIVPPRELTAAGLTVQNLFSTYLGSEDVDFVGYHMKRTTITLAIHSCFPLCKYIQYLYLKTISLQLTSPQPFGKTSLLNI